MTPADEQIIAHQAKTSAAVRRLVEECERLKAERVEVNIKLAEMKSARDEACEMVLRSDTTISCYERAHELLEVGKVSP
jgi:uncharacterized coiled-coil DUF342 family protein